MEDRPFSQLKKLHITRRQWLGILKWSVYALCLTAVLVVQGVILSRLPAFGAKVNLVPYFIGALCVVEGADRGSVFALVASFVWAMSGGDLGFVSILTLTGGGMAVGLMIQRFLRQHVLTCMILCLLLTFVHDSAVFALHLFVHRVTPPQFWHILVPGVLLGLPACPVFYYLFRAIHRIGGSVWSE